MARSVDVHVGTRIRTRRAVLGMSQQKLAEALGLSFQQVQKYETGANRVSASQLYDICRALDVPVAYFFDDIESVSDDAATSTGGRVASNGLDYLTSRETLELVRAYCRIRDPRVRHRICAIAKTLGGPENA
jgi:transcriptional regulator with XRE-family HTH domain